MDSTNFPDDATALKKINGYYISLKKSKEYNPYKKDGRPWYYSPMVATIVNVFAGTPLFYTNGIAECMSGDSGNSD